MDADPQGNATSAMGINKNRVNAGTYNVLADQVPPREAIIKTNFDQTGLYVKPLEKIDINTAVEEGAEGITVAASGTSELALEISQVNSEIGNCGNVSTELQDQVNQFKQV